MSAVIDIKKVYHSVRRKVNSVLIKIGMPIILVEVVRTWLNDTKVV